MFEAMVMVAAGAALDELVDDPGDSAPECVPDAEPPAPDDTFAAGAE